jgi:multidrug efflux system membrane fusion protein
MNTLSFFLISGTAALLFSACAKKAPVTTIQEQAICVKTETLFETNASVPIQAAGILSSKHILKLSFKTGGIISKIYVEEGAEVKKGQVIAELDMTEISAQVSQANLAFEKAKRDLERVKNLYNDTVARCNIGLRCSPGNKKHCRIQPTFFENNSPGQW